MAWQPISVFLPGESPWTEESGGLQSMGLQKVRHNWATKYTHYYFLVWCVVGCLCSFYMDRQPSQNLLLINPHFSYLSQILSLSHTEHLYMHKSFEFPILFIGLFVYCHGNATLSLIERPLTFFKIVLDILVFSLVFLTSELGVSTKSSLQFSLDPKGVLYSISQYVV